jgi:tetratricopeptide (TPR) repeat protein
VAGLFTAWVESEVIGAKGADFALTLIGRCLVAGRIIWFYLCKILWPVNLTFIYPRWTIDSAASWQYLFPLAALALAAAVWLLRKRSRGPLAGFLLFAGTLFPVLGFFNIFPFRYSFVADHFQYLASLGIIVPVAAGLAIAARRIPAAPALAALLLATLGAMSWRQSGMYRDAETLYKETIARNPDCWMAHHNLAIQLALLPERLPEAVAEFQATLRIKPDHPEAHRNLGLALSKIPGQFPQAIAEYEAALRLNPDDADARLNLGSLLSRLPGREPEAVAHLRAALRLRPDSAEAHYALANMLVRDQPTAAIAEYQAALRVRPDYAEAHLNLGNLLVTIPNRAPDAIAEYEAALRLNPEYLEAHFNLGTVLMHFPARRSDAIAHLEAALRIQPDLPDAHLNLGAALSDIPGRAPDAIHHLQAALEKRPDAAPARQLLHRLLALAPPVIAATSTVARRRLISTPAAEQANAAPIPLKWMYALPSHRELHPQGRSGRRYRRSASGSSGRRTTSDIARSYRLR